MLSSKDRNKQIDALALELLADLSTSPLKNSKSNDKPDIAKNDFAALNYLAQLKAENPDVIERALIKLIEKPNIRSSALLLCMLTQEQQVTAIAKFPLEYRNPIRYFLSGYQALKGDAAEQKRQDEEQQKVKQTNQKVDQLLDYDRVAKKYYPKIKNTDDYLQLSFDRHNAMGISKYTTQREILGNRMALWECTALHRELTQDDEQVVRALINSGADASAPIKVTIFTYSAPIDVDVLGFGSELFSSEEHYFSPFQGFKLGDISYSLSDNMKELLKALKADTHPSIKDIFAYPIEFYSEYCGLSNTTIWAHELIPLYAMTFLPKDLISVVASYLYSKTKGVREEVETQTAFVKEKREVLIDLEKFANQGLLFFSEQQKAAQKMLPALVKSRSKKAACKLLSKQMQLWRPDPKEPKKDTELYFILAEHKKRFS